MARPIQVKVLKPYTIWVKFADGAEGEADLSHLAGKGVFAAWRTKGGFEKAHIDLERGTVAWDAGIDICPDTLYMQVTGKAIEEVFPFLALPRASSHARN